MGGSICSSCSICDCSTSMVPADIKMKRQEISMIKPETIENKSEEEQP